MQTFRKWIDIKDPILRSAQQMFCVPRVLKHAKKGHQFWNPKGQPVHPMPLQNAEYQADIKTLQTIFYANMPVDWIPVAEAIKFTVAIILPYRKLDIKAKATGLISKTSKPDIDNSVKMYLDAMTKSFFFQDDQYVVQCDASKWRGPHPGVYIKIEPADPQGMWDEIAPVAGWQPETLFGEEE